MATQTLKQRHRTGIFTGFGNLFNKEMGDWWRSKRWLVVFAIFLITINGMMLIMSSLDQIVETERNAALEAGVSAEELAKIDAEIAAETPTEAELVMMYFLFGGAVMAITTIVLAQDAIVGERQLGTAQWIVSKPISRPSFVLSKFAAHGIGLLAVGILAQGTVAFALLSFRAGIAINPISFMLGSGTLWLVVLFFLALTLMLGTFSDSRALVAGVPIGLLLMFQMITGIMPFLTDYLPHAIIFPLGIEPTTIAANLAIGTPVTNWMPLLATVSWIAIFLGVALWRFSQEEF